MVSTLAYPKMQRLVKCETFVQTLLHYETFMLCLGGKRFIYIFHIPVENSMFQAHLSRKVHPTMQNVANCLRLVASALDGIADWLSTWSITIPVGPFSFKL